MFGEFDPDAVTEQLGVSPSWIERTEESTPTGRLRDVRSLWVWTTRTRTGPFAEDVALEVLGQFESSSEALRRLVEPELSGTKFSIVVRMRVPPDHPHDELGHTPALFFSFNTLAALHVALAILPFVHLVSELDGDDDPTDHPARK